jgi:alpha-1,2-mannosyltransferase
MGKNVFPRNIVFPQPPFGPAVGYILHWSLTIENRPHLLNSNREKIRRQTALYAFVGLAAIFLSLWNAPRAGTTSSLYGNDFTVFYAAAERIVATGNPYDIAIREHTPYLYPPLFAHLLAPLTFLSLPVASFLWTFGNCVAFALLFAASFQQIKETNAGPRLAWLIAFLPLLLGNLALGQVNLWIAFLATFALTRDLERRTPWSAGLALALAISIKLTPAVLLVHFAARRSWKLLAWCAGFGVALNGASFLALGPDRVAILRGWFNEVIVNGWKFNFAVSGNQSLNGAFLRFLTTAPTDAPRFPSVTILDTGSLAPTLFLCLCGLLLGFSAWRSYQSVRNEQAAHAAALAACACLLLSKLSWVVHFTMLALPAALVAQNALDEKKKASRWLALGALLCFWSSFRFIPEALRIGAETFSFFTMVAVGFAAYCFTARTTTPSDCSEELQP